MQKWRLFGKMKKKENDGGMMKKSQSACDIMTGVQDLEEDFQCSHSILASRSLSHESIFLAEQCESDPEPPGVLSQENIHGKIRAVQLKLQQQNIHLGPPPLVLSVKRTEDTGGSSEDDGLPHSPPENLGLSKSSTYKFPLPDRNLSSLSLGGTGSEEEEQSSLQHSAQTSSPQPVSPSLAPLSPLSPPAPGSGVDFNTPPKFIPCLDNSAARHRMSIKPRNQRASTKSRRLPISVDSRPRSESMNNLERPVTESEDEEVSAVTKEMSRVRSYSSQIIRPREVLSAPPVRSPLLASPRRSPAGAGDGCPTSAKSEENILSSGATLQHPILKQTPPKEASGLKPEGAPVVGPKVTPSPPVLTCRKESGGLREIQITSRFKSDLEITGSTISSAHPPQNEKGSNIIEFPDKTDASIKDTRPEDHHRAQPSTTGALGPKVTPSPPVLTCRKESGGLREIQITSRFKSDQDITGSTISSAHPPQTEKGSNIITTPGKTDPSIKDTVHEDHHRAHPLVLPQASATGVVLRPPSLRRNTSPIDDKIVSRTLQQLSSSSSQEDQIQKKSADQHRPTSGSFRLPVSSTRSHERQRAGSFTGVVDQQGPKRESAFLQDHVRTMENDKKRVSSTPAVPTKPKSLTQTPPAGRERVDSRSSETQETGVEATEEDLQEGVEEADEAKEDMSEDRKIEEEKNAFGVKLRTTSLSLKFREEKVQTKQHHTEVNAQTPPAVEGQKEISLGPTGTTVLKQTEAFGQTSGFLPQSVSKDQEKNIPAKLEDLGTSAQPSALPIKVTKPAPPRESTPVLLTAKETLAPKEAVENIPPPSAAKEPQEASSELSWMSMAREKTRSLQQMFTSRLPDFSSLQTNTWSTNMSASQPQSQTSTSQASVGATKPGQTQPGSPASVNATQASAGVTKPVQTEPGSPASVNSIQPSAGATKPGQTQPGSPASVNATQASAGVTKPVQTEPGSPASVNSIQPSAGAIKPGQTQAGSPASLNSIQPSDGATKSVQTQPGSPASVYATQPSAGAIKPVQTQPGSPASVKATQASAGATKPGQTQPGSPASLNSIQPSDRATKPVQTQPAFVASVNATQPSAGAIKPPQTQPGSPTSVKATQASAGAIKPLQTQPGSPASVNTTQPSAGATNPVHQPLSTSKPLQTEPGSPASVKATQPTAAQPPNIQTSVKPAEPTAGPSVSDFSLKQTVLTSSQAQTPQLSTRPASAPGSHSATKPVEPTAMFTSQSNAQTKPFSQLSLVHKSPPVQQSPTSQPSYSFSNPKLTTHQPGSLLSDSSSHTSDDISSTSSAKPNWTSAHVRSPGESRTQWGGGGSKTALAERWENRTSDTNKSEEQKSRSPPVTVFRTTSGLNKFTDSATSSGSTKQDRDDKWQKKAVPSSSSPSSSSSSSPLQSMSDSGQPSWMELAKRKSLAWSDKPMD